MSTDRGRYKPSSKPPTRQGSQGAEKVPVRRSLSTVGELVQAGGNRAALGILAYMVIGTVFWSLVGFLLDYLVGTQWLVLLGAGIGLSAGVALAYLHLQAGLKTHDGSDAGNDARNCPADAHDRGLDHDCVDGSRKDRH
ncbi:MAG: AtpZ/AtpI family protein [Kocuria sp.]|nr:AtpZ/AtpI family protein [Kocuria sp.]